MKLLILLFMPFHHISMVTAEAGCHSDRDKDHRPRQNCTAAGHSSVPAGFEPSTKVLLFPYNLFSRLIWSSFQIFPEIYEVDLTGNQVQEVTSTVSPVLPTLSVLRLTSNRLRELQDGAFTACPLLTELYLDNNILEALSDHTFSGLSQLEILDLSSNLIKVLPELLLHPLPAIETLLLENNKIKVVPDDWFINKVDVPYLYLSSNPWACFCSLGYLRGYLDEYELNFYVRDGPIINSDVMSVVCDSPQTLQGKSVISLESELCPPKPHPYPRGDGNEQSATTDQMTTTIAPTTTPPPPMAPSTNMTPLTSPPLTLTHPTNPSPPVISPSTPPTPMTPSKTHPPPTTPPPPMTPPTTPPPMTPSTNLPLTTPPMTAPPPTTRAPPMTPPMTPPMAPPTTYAFTLPPWDTDDHRHAEVSEGRGVFCFWLFAGLFLLCVATVACILATVARMFVWYCRAYRPLMLAMARKRRGGEGVRMLSMMEESGGVTALYRSILYVHREEEEPNPVTMEVPGGGVMREGRGRRGERDIYRKTLHRVLRREEELEGWQDVVEECRIDGERKGGSSRKRYSVILREEREKEEGTQEELNWVVGGWEVTGGGGGGEPCSSWGEWLAQYVPSMPWRLTTPPEEEACH